MRSDSDFDTIVKHKLDKDIMISSSRILCLLAFSIASILHHIRIVSSFSINSIRGNQFYAMKSGFIMSRAYRRHTTKLKNDKLYQDDDFASFNDHQNDQGGADLAAQFYQELEYRDIAKGDSSEDISAENDTMIRRSIGRKENDGASTERRRVVSSQNKSTSNETLLEFLFSLFASPSPPQSAGLFSGQGTTVYSTRSIKAEIQILESTIKNNEENEKLEMDKEQLEVRVRTVLISLIILSAAYIALETGDLDSVGTLVNDISEGLSSIMISESDALLGDAASDVATSLVDAVKSIETLGGDAASELATSLVDTVKSIETFALL